ncbi:hypothetical protein BDR06DRAFT_966949 [Suillus hirtellus]|nr:hypothetical protein BDR06DRAFT_966949 [Suillus hirtellus]
MPMVSHHVAVVVEIIVTTFIANNSNKMITKDIQVHHKREGKIEASKIENITIPLLPDKTGLTAALKLSNGILQVAWQCMHRHILIVSRDVAGVLGDASISRLHKDFLDLDANDSHIRIPTTMVKFGSLEQILAVTSWICTGRMDGEMQTRKRECQRWDLNLRIRWTFIYNCSEH